MAKPEPGAAEEAAAKPRQLVSTRELRWLLGISTARIAQLVADGVIVKEGHSRYDIYTVIPTYCENLRRGKLKVYAPAGSLEDSKTREAKAKADSAVLEYEERVGRLIDAGSVEKAWGVLVARFRQQLLALGVKLAPLVAVEKESDTCEALIRNHVNSVLEELSSADTSDAIATEVEPATADASPGAAAAQSTAETDDQPMGGPAQDAEPGSVGGDGPVDDQPG